MYWWNLKIFSRTTWSILSKLGKKHSRVKDIQICSNEGPYLLQRGDNYEIAKIKQQNSKIFFSWTTGPISIKLGTNHSWVVGIQVCSNKGLCRFPTGDSYEILKIHWQNLKIFSSTTIGPISTKLGTKHS